MGSRSTSRTWSTRRRSATTRTSTARVTRTTWSTLADLSLIRPLRFLSPAQFGADGGTAKGIKAPVGTGPWVHAEARKGEYDLFKRNESYWGKKPELAEVLVKVVPEGDSRVAALETGDLDLIFGTSGHGAAQISLTMD